MKKQLFIGAIAAQSVLSASNLLASSAATIFGDASGTVVTYDNVSGAYPVVTAILNTPGVTINGYTYSATSGTFLTADSTGGMEIYNYLGSGYTPTVGDA